MSDYVQIAFAVTTYKFGYVGEDTGAAQILGRLLRASAITRAIRVDKNFENSTLTVVLNDTPEPGQLKGFITNLLSTAEQYCLGKSMKFYRNDVCIFSGLIDGFPRSNPGEIAIRASVRKPFRIPINQKITSTDYATAPSENIGKYGNIIFGTASDELGNHSGICTALKVSAGHYLAAWHHLASLVAVFDMGETEITSLCSLDNNVDGRAYIHYTSPVADENEIYFNCTGYDDGGLVVNPATMLDDINKSFGSFTIDGIADAATIFTDRGYDDGGASIVIKDGQTWDEFFTWYGRNFDCHIFQKANGNLKIKVLNWDEEVPVATVNENYTLDDDMYLEAEGVVSEYRRMYFYHFRKDFFQNLPQDIVNATSWQGMLTNLDLRFIGEDLMAQDVSGRTMRLFEKPLLWYKFTIRADLFSNIELGDAIKYRQDWGFNAGGYRLAQIYMLEYAGADYCNVTALDINYINEGSFRLWLDGDPAIVHLHAEADPACEHLT